jgi:hypothetical protein
MCPPQKWTTIMPKKMVASTDEDKWGTLYNVYWRMTRRAVPAPRKGNHRQGRSKDNVASGVPKGRTMDAPRRQQLNKGSRLDEASAS